MDVHGRRGLVDGEIRESLGRDARDRNVDCETIRIPGEGGRRRRRGVDGTWGGT